MGFKVELGRAHQTWVVTHPDFDGCEAWFSTSPSDWRWKQNTLRRISHEFGVEIRL